MREREKEAESGVFEVEAGREEEEDDFFTHSNCSSVKHVKQDHGGTSSHGTGCFYYTKYLLCCALRGGKQ